VCSAGRFFVRQAYNHGRRARPGRPVLPPLPYSALRAVCSCPVLSAPVPSSGPRVVAPLLALVLFRWRCPLRPSVGAIGLTVQTRLNASRYRSVSCASRSGHGLRWINRYEGTFHSSLYQGGFTIGDPSALKEMVPSRHFLLGERSSELIAIYMRPSLLP